MRDFIINFFIFLFFSWFLIILFILVSLYKIILGQFNLFYKNKLVGKNGKLIDVYKFRTLISEKENQFLNNHVKYLYGNNFLRKLRLDEIPQVINILKGEMNFIGPRPQSKIIFDKYYNNEMKKIYNLKPGIFSEGALYNLSASNKGVNYLSYLNNKVNKDIFFFKKRSFFNDLKLIIICLFTVIFKNNKTNN